MFGDRLIKILKRIVKSDIRIYHFVRRHLLRRRLFLPHDNDYWGFILLPKQAGIFLDVGANDGISATLSAGGAEFGIEGPAGRVLHEQRPHSEPSGVVPLEAEFTE